MPETPQTCAILALMRLDFLSPGRSSISLIAEDTHQDALRLYRAKGYTEIARRPVVKDDWPVEAREWILFLKAL